MHSAFFIIYLTVCLCAFKIATPQYNFYFGNLHAHTGFSDGSLDGLSPTPAFAFQYAKESYQFDFLGISEHNHYTAYKSPGMILSNYAKGLMMADSLNEDGIFVALFGMEFGQIASGGHMLVYNVPQLIGWETGNYDIFCKKYDYAALYNIVNDYENAFISMAHPSNNDYNNLLEGSFYPKADSAIKGVSIRSGPAFSKNTSYSDASKFDFEERYFYALSKGYHIGPMMDHDNHYTNFGRSNASRTVVLAKMLNKDTLIEAINKLHFYASDDWNAEMTFSINNKIMGTISDENPKLDIKVSLNDPVDILGHTDKTSSITLYKGMYKSGILPVIEYSNSNSDSLLYHYDATVGTEVYFLCKIVQEDGDVIWSAPIWLQIKDSTTSLPQISFQNTQQILLFPNPSNSQLSWLPFKGSEQVNFVKIFDAKGRLVYSETLGKQYNKLNIIHLDKGAFLIYFYENNNKIAVGKFTKI